MRRHVPRLRIASAIAPLFGALVLVLCGATSAGAGTLVSLNFTNFGTVQVDLFTELAPLSVANFLHYVNDSLYDDTMIHRVDTGLGVIQGGGYSPGGVPVATFEQVNNESWLHNRRGTLAMARGGDVDSAKSQWFINTDNNTVDLGLAAGQGYSVFGWVVGGGMSVVDAIAAVPTFNYDPPFNQIPLQDFTQQDKINGVDPTPHAVVLASVEVISTHPTFRNPISRVDVNNDGLLTPLDSLIVINSLNAHGIHFVDPFESNPFAYRDVNGDGLISPSDLVVVINSLIANGTGNPAPLAMPQPQVSSLAVVPEPRAWVLAAWCILALGCLIGYRTRLSAAAAA
ncbi:MAG: peptidylprolyl isomerase [Pirellulales bacterium]